MSGVSALTRMQRPRPIGLNLLIEGDRRLRIDAEADPVVVEVAHDGDAEQGLQP